MSYQSIRAVFEAPLLAAYSGLIPAVPVYFDNAVNVEADSVDEFVQVSIQFGLTTEPALTTSHKLVRGVVVVRLYTPKNTGPGRNQQLTDLAFSTLEQINNTPKGTSGVYVRLGSIDGPSFGPTFGGTTPDQQSRRAFTPFFVSRLETSFQATVLA
jgi:hypothetical protein